MVPFGGATMVRRWSHRRAPWAGGGHHHHAAVSSPFCLKLYSTFPKMAEAKPLKYPDAFILEKGNRIRITSKSTIWQCILDIQSKYKQNPEKPSKLKERQLKKFKKSCFGTLFLRMRELVLSGGIIHNMIARQADSLNTEVMEFNFNDKGAIFTWKEFGLILGLKMKHSLDAIPPPSSIN
ncbi:hypothetical protein FNV43_RR08773 [Rhamnella rubrinervis]|uniref:Uncharacterized protein n=1 Tax=Rhamnella rubrinervis TaxID=2594499 RepID=A0A8K0H9W6_9ROSA|nr:hypothetical protein FNV43_RR08773 [Rhamnella rubrinervis]